MLMSALHSGCVFWKNRDIAVFSFQPYGKGGETVVRALVGTQWHVHKLELEWAAIGMAAAKYPAHPDWQVVAASSEGHLWEVTAGIQVEKESQIPGDHDGLTKLASIGDAVWACGMGRVVLRREADGTWTNLSAPDPPLEEGVIGFNAIAGTAQEVTAVGWKGEIWVRTDERWEAQDSGTNTHLNAVSVSPDGQVVAVGDDGTVVVGRRNQWSVLDIDVEFNFQGVCHFGDQVFLCTDFDIYRLEKDRLVGETRFANGEEPRTCLNLLSGRESVFSQGEKDIFKFSEGIWTRVFSIGPGGPTP